MTPEYDVIVVGSGPAGVSVALPLVEGGLRVLMVDGGKQSSVSPPDTDYITARNFDVGQWKWMIGTDYHALKMRDAVSPKLRVPTQAFAFEDFESKNMISANDFITAGSLATGGLSNAWGCGVARYSDAELAEFPFPVSQLDSSYRRVGMRVGISGAEVDDMSNYFGLDEFAQPPVPMDCLHTRLSQRYSKHRKGICAQGFRLGRSRVAVLSEASAGRQACNRSSNCLWGCGRQSMYSATHDLPGLRKYENFNELHGFVVNSLVRNDNCWAVEGGESTNNDQRLVTARRIVLAAGTLATTRIVLKTLKYTRPVRLLSSPTAAFLLWLPRFIGARRDPGFGLGQLSFSVELRDNVTAFGSTFSTTGIPVSEFARHVPLQRRYSIDFLRGLLSSCVVGNLFLPGHLVEATAALGPDDYMTVSGKYCDKVGPLMENASRKLRKCYWKMGAIMLPGSFTLGQPGGDIHYAGTLPMRKSPGRGETSKYGEVEGLDNVFVVDGASLPTLSEKSHTLTIMANADRIGRWLAGSADAA